MALTKERRADLAESAEKDAERIRYLFLDEEGPVAEQVYYLGVLIGLAREEQKRLKREAAPEAAEAETTSPIGEGERGISETPRKSRQNGKSLLDQAGVTNTGEETPLGRALTTILRPGFGEKAEKGGKQGPSRSEEEEPTQEEDDYPLEPGDDLFLGQENG